MNKKDYTDKRGKPQEYTGKPQGSQGYNNKNQDYRDKPGNSGYNNKPQDQRDRNQQSQGGYNKYPNNQQRPNDGYKGNREEYKQQQPKNLKPNTSQNVPPKDQNIKEEFKEYFEQVKQFEEKMDDFKKNPENPEGIYYLLSNKALKEWKGYLDYPNLIAEKRPNISISQKPAKVNEDLVSTDKLYLQYQDKQSTCAVVLKPDLVEGQDYIIVNKNVWDYFSSKYAGTEIKRKGTVNIIDEKTKQVVLIKDMHVVTLIFIYSTYLKSLEGNKNEALRIRKLQIPMELSVKAFKTQIAKIFNKLAVFKFNIESGYIRLWSPDPRFETNEAFREYLHEACVKSKTFDYQIQYDGNLLDRDPSSYVEEVNPELKNDWIVEINNPGKLWILMNDSVKSCKKCDYCKKIDFLEPGCQCGQVAYCSEACKYSDKGAHAAKCDKAYDSDENKDVTPSATPIDGLAGLENLGNSCYMNCSIQCLSNIKEMTDYFISQKYLSEINEKNPLGMKGKIAKKYAYLVKRLWLENKRDLAPYSLKIAVSKFQTMFHGQHQHDAQEFLFFLMDAIHEDLNRVLEKPYTESIEAGNKTDLQVGKESWEAFLKRNQSIIVDLMYGQYKSSIECSVCKSVSKNFESFSICSLPIPNQKEIEIFFVHENYKTKPYRMLLKYPDNKHTLKDLRDDLAAILDKSPQAIQLAIGDKTSITVQHDLSPTTFQVSHDLKSKYLCAFELSQEEMNIPLQRRVFVGFQTLKADYANEPKEIVGIMKLIALDRNMTNREVHLKIFQKYRFQFDEKWPFKSGRSYSSLSLEQACDEAFSRFKQPIYDVYIVKGTTEKVQEGVLDYDDESFSKTLSKCRDPENEIVLEVDWKYIPAFFEIEYFKSFVRQDPYKSGIQDRSNGEKRFLDISDCLKSFADPEELDENNAWYCKKCTKHQTAFKVLELYKLPKIFIIHLKRFKTGDNTRWNRTESKISDMITFPLEDFDLKPFVNNPNLPSDYFSKELNGDGLNGNEEAKYDLVGVIHHIGSLNSGHYITFAKNAKSGDWYKYDDEKVKKVDNLAQIVTDTAYILFYQRK